MSDKIKIIWERTPQEFVDVVQEILGQGCWSVEETYMSPTDNMYVAMLVRWS